MILFIYDKHDNYPIRSMKEHDLLSFKIKCKNKDKRLNLFKTDHICSNMRQDSAPMPTPSMQVFLHRRTLVL